MYVCSTAHPSGELNVSADRIMVSLKGELFVFFTGGDDIPSIPNPSNLNHTDLNSQHNTTQTSQQQQKKHRYCFKNKVHVLICRKDSSYNVTEDVIH